MPSSASRRSQSSKATSPTPIARTNVVTTWDPEIVMRTDPHRPAGAYYAMTEIEGLGWDDDVAFARHLVEEVGVAVVPGSSFYRDPASGSRQVRFAFCKKEETLAAAQARLARLRPRARP